MAVFLFFLCRHHCFTGDNCASVSAGHHDPSHHHHHSQTSKQLSDTFLLELQLPLEKVDMFEVWVIF